MLQASLWISEVWISEYKQGDGHAGIAHRPRFLGEAFFLKKGGFLLKYLITLPDIMLNRSQTSNITENAINTTTHQLSK